MLTRRTFLTAASGALLGGALDSSPHGQSPPASQPAKPTLPTITLGRTERALPRLGIGAAPLGDFEDDDRAIEILLHALKQGVRYIDTAPSYGHGHSERRIGLALAAIGNDVPRGDLFIATKTLHRDAAAARRELEESLKRLQVEYIDSVQCHEVHDDVQELFKKDSVLSALKTARDEGLIKHIGVTGHRDPRWLVDAIDGYPFATALVPINPLDKQHRSFINEFLPVAIEKKVAVIAMKVYAGGRLIQDGKLSAPECLRYALTQPGVAIAVPGCSSIDHVDHALQAVADFKMMNAQEQSELEHRAGEHQGRQSEWYKDPES
jgi:aryl-alcohol dehydrogenase-like predicted oxidoreductase